MTRWLWCGLLVAGVASASTLVQLDVPTLTRSADVVVRGTVVRVEPRWSGDRARILTDAEVQVAEVLKGAAGKVVIATQPGGELGDVGQRVHGAAHFEVGVEVVLFLERRGDRFTVTGMSQGAFSVKTEAGALVVRQQGEADLSLVDAATHRAVDAAPITMPYAQLVATVRGSAGAPSTKPQSGTSTVAP